MSRTRGRALGRGLEALIPMSPKGVGSDQGIPRYIGIDEVRPSREQMRRLFPADSLHELANSIRQHGVLQPVIVQCLADGYELLAGERRWRAARLAGLDHIPAMVRVDTEAESGLLLGLIENLQREDLDPIEEARGIQRLIDRFGLTQEQAAQRLGKHRVSVAQALRLLSASPAVVSATAAGAITAGHARALAGLPTTDQERGLKLVLGRRLSVRQTEHWVHDSRPVRPPESGRSDGPLAEVEGRLRGRFGDAVSVRGTSNRGAIMLRYKSRKELDDLLGSLLS